MLRSPPHEEEGTLERQAMARHRKRPSPAETPSATTVLDRICNEVVFAFYDYNIPLDPGEHRPSSYYLRLAKAANDAAVACASHETEVERAKCLVYGTRHEVLVGTPEEVRVEAEEECVSAAREQGFTGDEYRLTSADLDYVDAQVFLSKLARKR